MSTTKSSVLPTLRGFHYQILLGVRMCFELEEGQSIWFESDGDISLRDDNNDSNIQMESKLYDVNNPITDNHDNFWNTLNNWLKDDFDYQQYAYLILHTTQPTSEDSKLSGWNSKSSTEKLDSLKAIYDLRTDEQKNRKDSKGVLAHQQNIFKNNTDDKLKEVLGKVLINDNQGDLEDVLNELPKRLIGIPKNNIETYIDSFIGAVYRNMNKHEWSISKTEVDDVLEYLTSKFSKSSYTFPKFTGRKATQFELEKHKESLFVKKIKDIDYEDQIIDAVGNYAELTNALLQNLDQSPVFSSITENYQGQVIDKFKRSYLSHSIEYSNIDKKSSSKLFYNKVIDEPTEKIEGCEVTPKPYRNGLIHDAMDNNELKLEWRIT